MNDLIINVAAGLISGVLTPFVVARLGGGTPAPPKRESVDIDGDGNVVQQVGPVTNEFTVYESIPAPRSVSPTKTLSGGDDPLPVAAGALMALFVLVLAYMFTWPVVVWALSGAGLGLATASVWIHKTTAGTPGPRSGALFLALTSTGLLFLAAWWTLNGGPGGSLSSGALEAKVVDRFPTFNDGLSQRWDVITTNAVDVFRIVGWPGVFFILTQILAMECAVLLVWARTRELAGWVALRNLVDHPNNTHLARRAKHFKEIGASSIALTLFLGMVLAGTSGGWAHTWMEVTRSRQSHPIVSTP